MRLGLMPLIFLAGFAIGVIGTVLAPRYLDPYLPEAIRGKVELIEGTVIAKDRQSERLLLTILTPQGALLATFEARVAETGLLVEVGDVVTLALRGYESFVEDPVIARVVKSETPPSQEPETAAPPSALREGEG